MTEELFIFNECKEVCNVVDDEKFSRKVFLL